MPDVDPWDLPSGAYGPTRPYTFDVLSARFVVDPTDEMNPDVVKLRLEGTTDDPDWEEWTIDLRCDKEIWEILDDGDKILSSNAKKLSPSRNTQYGVFLTSVQQGAEDNEELSELMSLLKTRGTPTTSEIWRGLRLIIDERENSFYNRTTKKQQPYFETIVSSYEGLIDSDTMRQMDSKRNEARQALEEELAAAAQKFDNHADFANHALNEIGVTDSELINQVMDSGKDGFYENHKA